MKRDMVTAKDRHGNTALSYATKSDVVEIVRLVSKSMARYLPAPQVTKVDGPVSSRRRGASL